jgi:excisionase family DNA binding protein
MNDEILTKEELAAFLKVTPRTIDNLRKKGLPYFTVGDSVRFHKAKAMNWLEENRNGKKRGKRSKEHAPGQ